MKPEMVKALAISIDVEHQVDGLLKANRFDDVATLLLSEGVGSLSLLNRDIYILRIMSQIYLLEKGKSIDRGIFERRNVKDIIRLYRITSLFLRRLEHNFPIEKQKEVISYIVNKGISTEAIWGIIQYNSSIINKDRVIDQLRTVMEQY